MFASRRVRIVLPAIAILTVLAAGCGITRAIRPRVKSPVETPEGVLFRHYAPSAIRMNLAGDFNQWCDTANGRPIDVTMDPMTMDDKGIWSIVKPLEPGTYQYKYIIDGGIWQHDTNNLNTTPDGYGGVNSVVTVKERIKLQEEKSAKK
jgi:1,4-alpha-glucan branching enzyme